MTERHRLLFVSPRFLFPTHEGGKIRTANILRHLRGGNFEIALASPAPANADAFAADIAAVCDRFISWPAQPASVMRRVAALPGRLPVAVASDRSKPGSAAVAAALSTGPDLVVVDFPHAAVLLPESLPHRSLIFTHNVEAEIFARHATVTRGLSRLVWRSQARKMERFEGDTLRRFDSVIAVSKRDAAALQRLYDLPSVECIDTGVDLAFHRFTPRSADPPRDGGTVVFCGAMDWRANVDGITFLMDEVWPLVLAARPAARAIIVGRNPPKTLIAAASSRGMNWQFTGYVDDVRPYVADADVYVIPLRVGSGTRIKAFEAMAAGCPVVSTALGVEGLDVTSGQHLLIADTAPEFAAAILRLLAGPAVRSGMAVAARHLVEQRFSWQQVGQQFEAICLRLLNRARD